MSTIGKKPQELQTICELHRRIWRETNKDEPSIDHIRELVEEAYPLGKKIVNKLRQYKKNFDNGWYERHKLDGAEIHEDD